MKGYNQREKLGTHGRVPGFFIQHIPHFLGLYNGFMGQYGVTFWDQLLGDLPKGTQNFPLIQGYSDVIIYLWAPTTHGKMKILSPPTYG